MKFIILVLLVSVFATGCSKPKDGKDGVSGEAGSPGLDGSDGTPGEDGTDGRDGEDGSIITMVKFCAGDHDNYPDSFPEYGFCIDGKLYATFSDKGGFTALLTPGNYQSNAINSKCNFIVMPGCQVQEIQ